MASKLTKLMNKTSISSLKSAIKSPTQAAFVSTPCKSTSLFRQFSLRSPLELGGAQLILPLFRMSACMSTSSKSGKAPGKASSQGPSRNTGRIRAAPQNAKFPKQHKGRMKGISHQGNHISFGNYALQALEHSWISSRQIEAGRKAMIQYVRRDGKIWVRIFPDKPVTVRPTETRMGRGKGSCAYWVAVVQPGRILYEMGGVTERMARKAISTASSKMPIRTQFISLG